MKDRKLISLCRDIDVEVKPTETKAIGPLTMTTTQFIHPQIDRPQEHEPVKPAAAPIWILSELRRELRPR